MQKVKRKNLQGQLNIHAICMWRGGGKREGRSHFEGLVNGSFGCQQWSNQWLSHWGPES